MTTIVDFPYKKYFMKDVKKIFNQLCTFDYRDRMIIVNYQLKKNMHSDFMGKKYIFLTKKEDYERYNEISDYFQEECRIHCVFKGKLTLYEYYQKNEQYIIEQLHKDRKTVNYKNLRDKLYELSSECSTFKPVLMKGFLEMFDVKSVLDFSSGWGDRLIGFLASNATTYYGFDPNTCLYRGYNEIINMFNKNKKIKLFPQPFEKISNNLRNRLKNKFDAVITSPPYFTTEKYSNDKTQSISSYKTENNWFHHFLKKSINISIASLKSGGYLIININEEIKYNYVNKFIQYVNSKENMKFLGTIINSSIDLKNPQPFFIWKRVN